MKKLSINWTGVCNFLEKVGDILREAIIIVGAVIMTIILWCIAFPIFTVLIFNPVMFYLWSLIAPRVISGMFYDKDDEERPNNDLDAWCILMVAAYAWLCRKMLRWEVKLLPWYSKKEFISARPTDFNCNENVRYFRTLPEEEKTGFMTEFIPESDRDVFKTLKDELYAQMWSMRDAYICNSLLAAKNLMRKAFSKEEMQYIRDVENINTLKKYLEWATLSEAHLKALICSKNKDVLECAVNHIIANGVSSDFISWAYAAGENITSTVSENIEKHSQLVMTRQQKADSEQARATWHKYCQATPEICVEAQLEFNAPQASIFYSTGHAELAEEAIFYFFSEATRNKKQDVAKVIFEREGEKAIKSDRIKTMVKSNYWLNSHALGLN